MRLAVLALGAVIVAGLGVAVLRAPHPGSPTAPSGDASASIGGPFALVDQDGRAADQRVLAGKWSAVFFGYTNCPDTCPATLLALNVAAAKLGPARKDFQVVFVSIDPARDTPAQMKLYVANQGYPPGGLIGLTGSPAQVAAIANGYHVFYAKAGTGADYGMQHSAGVYLMDPKGRFSRPLDEAAPPTQLTQQIAAAMHG